MPDHHGMAAKLAVVRAVKGESATMAGANVGEAARQHLQAAASRSYEIIVSGAAISGGAFCPMPAMVTKICRA